MILLDFGKFNDQEFESWFVILELSKYALAYPVLAGLTIRSGHLGDFYFFILVALFLLVYLEGGQLEK